MIRLNCPREVESIPLATEPLVQTSRMHSYTRAGVVIGKRTGGTCIMAMKENGE
jgi:hypothetical protein